MLTPSIGLCGTQSTITGAGMRATSSSVGTMSMTWWNCQRMPPTSLILAGHEIAMPCRVPPKNAGICFIHWKGVSKTTSQPYSEMGICLVTAPNLIPLHLFLGSQFDTVERHHLVRGAGHSSFSARTVIAADVDDERVVELAHILDRLDHPTNLMIGVGEVGGVYLRLANKQLLLCVGQPIPALQQLVRPRRQLGVLRNHTELLLRKSARARRSSPYRTGAGRRSS